MKQVIIIGILTLVLSSFTLKGQVELNVDFKDIKGDMTPIWAWFGYDEPNYTYMKDGKKLLTEIADLSPVPVFIRTHNLMTSGDGTPALKWGSTGMYKEDAEGNPIYNWSIVDRIFDTYIKLGMKPLAQIGFMPKAMSTNPQPYQHVWKPGARYSKMPTGWAHPPKDYDKWSELVFQWVKHCIARYGKAEVESWYWQLWNEPDGAYWKGEWSEYFKLYDYTADAVKRALPNAKIGGSNVMGGGMKFQDAFLKHCISGVNYVTGKRGSPLDVVLFHAKGWPRFIDGKVVMSVRAQLNNIVNHFRVIEKYPELEGIEVIIGESDPEGCAACSMATNPENAYRNGTMYSSYTAASFARVYELADRHKQNLIGAVSWSFEFENQPWFAGFRDLATNGVDKPVLNVFRMFGMMSGKRVSVKGNRMYDLDTVLETSIRDESDIGGIATIDNNTAAVLIWNYHDQDGLIENEQVQISMAGLPANKEIHLSQYAIDQENSNSYELWKKMGSPQNPSTKQIKELEKAGMLKMISSTKLVQTENSNAKIDINLASQATVLLKFDW